MRDRLKGLEGIDAAPQPFVEAPDFPGYNAWREERAEGRRTARNPAVCIGPLAWKDRARLNADIDNLKSALRNVA